MIEPAQGSTKSLRSSARELLVAAAAVVTAALVRWALGPAFQERLPFITFFAAIALAAWYGGWVPGIVATLLSFLVGDYLFIPDGSTVSFFANGSINAVPMITFVAVGLVISYFANSLHHARHLAEEQSRQIDQQKNMLKVTLRSIGDAVIATDERGRITFMNFVAEELTGWREEEARGEPLTTVFKIISEQTRQPVEDPCVQVLQTGRVVGLANHTLLIAKNGAARPIDDSAAPILDEQGHILGAILVFRDVTARRQVEQGLRISEERFRLAARAGGIGIWDWNLTNDRLTLSEEAQKIYQLPPESFGGTRQEFLARVHPEDNQRIAAAVQQAVDTDDPYEIEFRVVLPDGETRWIASAARVFRDEQQRPVRMLGAMKDITQKRRADEILEFLSRTTTILAPLVDRQSALQQAVRLAVTFFADWALAYIVDEEGVFDPRAHAYAHVDPGKEPLLSEAMQKFPPNWSSASPLVRAMREGSLQHLPRIPESFLKSIARDERHLEILQELQTHSYIAVPITIRGRTVGSLAFVRSQREYGAEDLELAIDFTRRVATAIDNSRLLGALQEAHRQKDDFLAMLAHELRNPLAAIQYANSVSMLPDEGARADAQEIIDRQVKTLRQMIDDLLDVSRITRDKVQLKKEFVQVAQLVKSALAMVQPMIAERKHGLMLEPVAQDMYLHADSMRIEQIVSNLLTNAAKYTQDGGTIALRAYREGSDVVLKVKDSGIGIPREMLPRVFELFTQVDPALDRGQGGLGIGLTVARKLTEMHGGSISVNSEGVGQGSEFCVRLPLAQRPSDPGSTDAGRAPAATPALRVLVVDDNRDTAKVLAMLLRTGGHEVHVAHDGLAALDAARQHRPQVFLLDIGLPGIDGYELASRLRQEGFRDETLIAISGYGLAEDRLRSREAGYNHHLVKPVDFRSLSAVLSTIPAAANANS